MASGKSDELKRRVKEAAGAPDRQQAEVAPEAAEAPAAAPAEDVEKMIKRPATRYRERAPRR